MSVVVLAFQQIRGYIIGLTRWGFGGRAARQTSEGDLVYILISQYSAQY